MEAVLATTETTPDASGISDHSITIFVWVVVAGLCPPVNIFGIGTNIINTICFVKQGFREPVNISLMGLAITDLGCLVTHIGLNSFYIVSNAVPNLQFIPLEVSYMIVGLPHLAFTRVNVWITAIITLERCLCITLPLKVKRIITPKRTWTTIGCVYTILLLSGSPGYAVTKLGLKYFPGNNQTLFGILSSPYREKVEGITFTINSFFLNFVGFVIICVCTTILVTSLRRRAKWRRAAIQTDISTREQKVAKMVVMISAMSICSFIPVSVIIFAIAFEPRLQISGKYVNISTVMGCSGFLLEAINSSVNIFIYYHMSTKYRDTLRSMFYRVEFRA